MHFFMDTQLNQHSNTKFHIYVHYTFKQHNHAHYVNTKQNRILKYTNINCKPERDLIYFLDSREDKIV